MKTISFKSFLQVTLFLVVLVSTITVSISLYKNIKQVCGSEPQGSAISCLFDIMQ